MKTSIALFSFCALTLIVVCAGLGVARTETTPAQASAVGAALVDTPADSAIATPRTAPMRVMPTITVLADSSELGDFDERGDSERSVMREATVDPAGGAMVPLRASLPRARLGNPFYDFGRGNSVPAVAE